MNICELQKCVWHQLTKLNELLDTHDPDWRRIQQAFQAGNAASTEVVEQIKHQPKQTSYCTACGKDTDTDSRGKCWDCGRTK